MRIVSPGPDIAKSRAPIALGRTAIQIVGIDALHVTRIDAHLHGSVIGRHADHRAGGDISETLIRYFRSQKLGPRPMTRLAIGAPVTTFARRVEAPPTRAKLRSPRKFAALPTAVGVTAIARAAQKEDATTSRERARDEAKGQHRRAARKVGHTAGNMRHLVAITAA